MNLTIQSFWTRTGNRLKELGKTQLELCTHCGINHQTYRGWIVHGTYPSALQVVKMAKYLDISVEYLVTGEVAKAFPTDIQNAATKLLELSEEKRIPVIALINSQVDYWKSV